MQKATSCPTPRPLVCWITRLGKWAIVGVLLLAVGYNLERSHALQKDLRELTSRVAARSVLDAGVQQQLISQQSALAALQADEQTWALKETEYLVRLAQMRITVLQDVPTALAQLIAAEQRLSKLIDPQILPIRQQLAHDIGVLRAYRAVDTQGICLRLSALRDSMQTLPLVVAPIGDQRGDIPQPEGAVATTAAWRTALWTAWQEIKSMVKIRHHDEAMLIPILGVADRQRLQQTTLSLLDQAKWAVLNRNVMIYQQSLETLLAGLPSFLGITQQQLSALEAEIKALQQIDVAPLLPALTTYSGGAG